MRDVFQALLEVREASPDVCDVFPAFKHRLPVVRNPSSEVAVVFPDERSSSSEVASSSPEVRDLSSEAVDFFPDVRSGSSEVVDVFPEVSDLSKGDEDLRKGY